MCVCVGERESECVSDEEGRGGGGGRAGGGLSPAERLHAVSVSTGGTVESWKQRPVDIDLCAHLILVCVGCWLLGRIFKSREGPGLALQRHLYGAGCTQVQPGAAPLVLTSPCAREWVRLRLRRGDEIGKEREGRVCVQGGGRMGKEGKAVVGRATAQVASTSSSSSGKQAHVAVAAEASNREVSESGDELSVVPSPPPGPRPIPSQSVPGICWAAAAGLDVDVCVCGGEWSFPDLFCPISGLCVCQSVSLPTLNYRLPTAICNLPYGCPPPFPPMPCCDCRSTC